MTTVLVTTSADPRRVGLTYKIELPEESFKEWWDDHQILEQVSWIHAMGPLKDANTGFVVIHDDGRVESHAFRMNMSKLTELLASADYNFPSPGRGQGRPEKRVLISTTSKERRIGSATGRQAAY